VYRKHLHELADWMADFRENIAKQRISPTAKPGAIISALPSTPPETAEPLEQIFADVDRVIVPGVAHWAHPQFMGYFGCTTTGPGVFAEMIAAALNVNAMTWRTSPVATELETVVLNGLGQWLGLPDECGRITRSDLGGFAEGIQAAGGGRDSWHNVDGECRSSPGDRRGLRRTPDVAAHRCGLWGRTGGGT